ncbi:LacI family transcriptional regulator [Paenibacillus sp. 1011MAR3C5]|uniref:substrate-binding domain-containing protein n=1 Tax=Paenibacillus sp. 1011MAR3C5 TaxID=1675787 RepID=UPI000E6C9972|nr:substrate-binding domain-containing protein [Paenibacillus sp. 1011MAR3C5]RJE88832.1 LacI family transcriptional regulator [Paenibacillus sp. 1011MAR3C5]
MSNKITMQQIADSVGVSKFVVSKTLSGKGGVSEATRERVIAAATQLGYFTQKHAHMHAAKTEPMADASKNRQSVLLLMPNIRFQTKESLYWGRVMDGISARLEQDGYGMIIVSEQSVEHFVDILNPSGILGLIGVGEISTSLLLEVHRIGLPMVLVDHEDALIPTDTIFANNYESVYRLTKHLIGMGHRRMMFIGNVSYSRSFLDRFLGFRSALEERLPEARKLAKDDLLLSPDGLEQAEHMASVKRWAIECMNRQALPTALVCANDLIAIGTIRALEELGLSVPEQISVTGYDNIEDAYRIDPPLTTAHVPKEALGKKAVERLLGRIANKNEPLEKIMLTCDLLYRGTTYPVHGDRTAERHSKPDRD